MARVPGTACDQSRAQSYPDGQQLSRGQLYPLIGRSQEQHSDTAQLCIETRLCCENNGANIYICKSDDEEDTTPR